MSPTVVGWEYRTCLLLWWSENTKHLSYCGGVEVQNMSPTVVEWNTEHVTYYGGVEIQNMSPTVVGWKYRTCPLLWWSENTKHVSYCGGVEIQKMSPTAVEWKYRT